MGRQTQPMHRAYLALGANLGNRRGALAAAAAHVGGWPDTAITAVSCLYETTAVGGPPGQPDYLNAVLRIETRRSAEELLAGCLEIERALGRERAEPNAPRTIDLDILFYDDKVVFSDDLILPHPRLHVRRFVLQPLSDIDAHLRHPGLHATVGELLDRLPAGDPSTVRRVAGPDWR